MSALGDMYNIWGYPLPVGIDAGKCCCDCGSCDTGAIIDAVVDAIDDIDTGCSCDEIDRKIEAAKQEIIRECKCKCDGCRPCPDPEPTPTPPCPCHPCEPCHLCCGKQIEQAACGICAHMDTLFENADISGNFINLNELIKDYMTSHSGH